MRTAYNEFSKVIDSDPGVRTAEVIVLLGPLRKNRNWK